MQCAALRCHRRLPRRAKGISILAIWVIGIGLDIGLDIGLGIGSNCFFQSAMAAEGETELIQPPICSAATSGQLNGICAVTSAGNGHDRVKINLTAASAPIEIGGYKVVTENYNGSYVTPIVEAMPGDTVFAHLVNSLVSRPHNGMSHGNSGDNPTNLHYFHGGIVSPNNARPKSAELGNGDNVYVHLKSGLDAQGKPNSFDFEVPIPGEKMLDARVLEGTGLISHPVGLNWYHSHMHGISADQVMGGMSGLLSVGEATANVKAACVKDPNDELKCLNDVDKDTRDLRSRTKARYVILRDIPLKITKRPDQASGDSAEVDPSPDARDFSVARPPCGVWNADTSRMDVDNVKIRTGFCQRDKDSAFLFTLNGQRFPTITVPAEQNLLIRLGNLSANVPYWLELKNDADDTVLPLTLLSIDGVVPATPAVPGQAQKPVQALNDNDLLLMPAARAEIYVRNDEKPHADRQVYILRTRKQQVRQEVWPEIQLARIVLEPNVAASKTQVSLNVPVASPSAFVTEARINETAALPEGCVRDLDPAFQEYRRVTFNQGGHTSGQTPTDWSIITEIIRPQGTDLKDEGQYASADPDTSTIAGPDGGGMPFEEYVQNDGLVDWTKQHVCIQIDHGSHRGSHKQLWVLFNATGVLHNFHIHQMKFRLATRKELQEQYHIKPPSLSHVCPPTGPCAGPDYAFYDDGPADLDPGATRRWHDTIPLPPLKKVFVVMSFDARQQIGRFVFHCHILKHEDKGLMAPIEVWEPQAVSLLK
jgi:FtsP/CotA-like multicopper oxidase with cupredoxin domain